MQGEPGNIETPDGELIGRHDGLLYYTLGQRQGLGIGGLREHGDEPWYVAAKDEARNALIVAQSREHPLLWSAALQATNLHWFAGEPPADAFSCGVKTRYRQADVPCEVTMTSAGATVRFAEPVWAVTPGQYAVFYRSDVCLGGGVIDNAGQLTAAGIDRKSA